MIAQGEVYLVDFGEKYHSEFEKLRPALVIQSDRVNALLDQVAYKSVALIPLSSHLLEGAWFRVRIPARERLEKESDVVCNWICTMDFERIDLEAGVLTRLSGDELKDVKTRLALLVE